MTKVQQDVWFDKLKFCDFTLAEKALKEAYASLHWKEPKLPDVLQAVRELKRGEVPTDTPVKEAINRWREEADPTALTDLMAELKKRLRAKGAQ